MKRQGLTESQPGKWTRAEDYLGAMVSKRTSRRGRRQAGRTESESARMLLSTVPFLALLALLAVLAVSIMVVAFPGTQPQVKVPDPPPRQLGIAPKGWLQEAQREFHR